MKNKIIIVHLYPEAMNLYGDTGNIIVLKKRLEWRGFNVEIISVNNGEDIPDNADIIFGGGGQDASQGLIEKDFMSKKDKLTKMAQDGKVMLFICGLYQLMGRQFVTQEGSVIKGLSILPLETLGKKTRLIGNIVTNVEDVGDLVGYENHSGQTFLDDDKFALGKVIKGMGNNQESVTEGCRYKNVFGTYLHGPVLAKSPKFADYLINLALKNKGLSLKGTKSLDDSLEIKTAEVAFSRPR